MTGNPSAPVKRLIHGLDQTDRYIVLLHYADGLTVKEVSLVLDVPEHTVESTLRRLRGRLLDAIAAAQHQHTEPPFRHRIAAA